MGQLLGKVAGVVSGRRIVKSLSRSHQVLLVKSLSRSHQLLLFKSLSRSHQLLLVMRILLLVICLALLSDIHCRKGKKGKKTKSKGKPKPIKPSKAPPADITKEDCDALTQKLNDVAAAGTDGVQSTTKLVTASSGTFT